MLNDLITFKVHAPIKEYLRECLSVVDTCVDDSIASKLSSPETISQFTKKEIDTLKDVLSIKNYALFFSKEKPQDIQPAKFRKSNQATIDSWSLKQLQWTNHKRALYLDFLEDIQSESVDLIAKYRKEIIPFREDIPRVASFFREKLELEYNPSKECYLRNFIYSIEIMGVLIFAQTFSQGVDGFAMPHDSYPVIFFNLNRGLARQLFTIAHELAHIIFDSDGGFDSKISFKDDHKEEQRANTFAAHLLMPPNAFSEQYETYRNYAKPLEKLKEYFYTSEKAIFYHIKNMQIATDEELTKFEAVFTKKAEKPSEGRTKVMSKPAKRLLEHGINSTFQFFVAKNENRISTKDYYAFFEHSNAKNHPYSANTFAKIERMFLEGQVL